MKRLLLLSFAALFLLPGSAEAEVNLETISHFQSPVYLTSDPSDGNRLFVVERGGRVILRENGVNSVFLDLAPLEINSGGEEGLLSIAFAPDYATSGLFWAYYTNSAGDIEIDRFRSAGDSAPLSGRRQVLVIPHPGESNHNGGQLQFGPDELLYIGTGDGGGGGDPGENAQDTNELLGKMLRIDPREGSPYAVPAGNPYVGVSGRDEIFQLGLRNPWRFSFDAANGDMLIGDVGQGSWEEINYAPAPDHGIGTNWGWDCREGAHDFELAGCMSLTLIDPIFEYSHAGGRCSITGGYVSRDPGLEELAGRYLYADLCAGDIRSLLPGLPTAGDDQSTGESVSVISSFGEDACLRLYAASLGSGAVHRLTDGSPAACTSPPAPADADQDSVPDAFDDCPTEAGLVERFGCPAPVIASAALSLTLNGAKALKLHRKLSVNALSDAACTLGLSARITARGGRKLDLARRRVELGPGARQRVVVGLNKSQHRRVHSWLGRAGKVNVHFKGRCQAGDLRSTEATHRSRLKR